MPKNKGGRPTKMTELVVKKLEEAFLLGCTDEEACLYAGISRQTMTAYQQEHEEFMDRKELFKNNPILQARKSVVNNLEGDPHLALKFLERKAKSEFGPNIDINAKIELSGDVTAKQIEVTQRVLEREGEKLNG